MPQQFPMADKPVAGRDIDQFDCSDSLGDSARGGVGIQTKCSAGAVESQRRNHRHDAFVEQFGEQLNVDSLHLAGLLLVDAADDANRMGGDGVAPGRAEIVDRKLLKNVVREPVGCGNGESHRRVVGDAVAAEIGGLQ